MVIGDHAGLKTLAECEREIAMCKSVVRCTLACVMALLPIGGTDAARRFIGINTYTLITQGATVFPSTGLQHLSPLSADTLEFTFMLPPDYKNDSTLFITVYYTSAVADCGNFVLEGTRWGHFQPGKDWEDLPIALEPQDGSNVLPAPLTGPVVMTKRYGVPRSASGVPYRRGDVILANFKRKSFDPDDTCEADLWIPSVRVDYVTP